MKDPTSIYTVESDLTYTSQTLVHRDKGFYGAGKMAEELK